MPLANYQLSYNGLVFGANTGIELTSITGLREAPATRGSDVTRPRHHGNFAGRTYFAERIVTATLQVWATSGYTFEQQLQRLSAAFANITDPASLLPLQFQLPGWTTPRQVVGRVTKGGAPIDVNYQYGKAAVPVEWTCPDPLIYDTATQSVTTGLPTTTAGLTFPVTFNASFGASSGGTLTLANGGNEAAPVVFTIAGPATWPSLTIGGQMLGFQVSLASGDTLVIDCDAKTAVLNGTASRVGTLMPGSSWLSIPPGGASAQFSTVDSSPVAGTATATLAAAVWGWC